MGPRIDQLRRTPVIATIRESSLHINYLDLPVIMISIPMITRSVRCDIIIWQAWHISGRPKAIQGQTACLSHGLNNALVPWNHNQDKKRHSQPELGKWVKKHRNVTRSNRSWIWRWNNESNQSKKNHLGFQ